LFFYSTFRGTLHFFEKRKQKDIKFRVSGVFLLEILNFGHHVYERSAFALKNMEKSGLDCLENSIRAWRNVRF